jgi:hypothetical protein
MSMSDEIQEPFLYGRMGENPNAPGSTLDMGRLTRTGIQFDPHPDALITVLTRIADALDRAYPLPASKPIGQLKPGVAKFNYEDPQTEALRKLRAAQETPSDR